MLETFQFILNIRLCKYGVDVLMHICEISYAVKTTAGTIRLPRHCGKGLMRLEAIAHCFDERKVFTLFSIRTCWR